MKTKFFTCFLALAASVGTMLASVTIDGIAYNLNETDLTAEVGLNIHSSGDIVIPSSVTYDSMTYSVTSIGYQAFGLCSGLTSIEIPNSVTSIGSEAFYGCIGLTSVTIPNSVTSIGEQAFYRCSGLTSVTIPNSVTSIGNSAFLYCTGLTSVIIPNSVTDIETSAFESCTSLTSVTIGNSVTSIGYYAFSGCTGLTSVTIPNSVTSIGDYTFSDCTSLTSVTIGNSVTSIGWRAFEGCTGLTDIYVACGDLDRVMQMLWNDSRVKYPPLPYSVSANAENGSVSFPQTICDAMELSARAYYGYHFTQWSDGNTENPRTFTLTQDTTFTAEFAHNPIITYEYNPQMGQITGPTMTSTGMAEENITFEAIPYYGYHFVQWNDGNKENPRTIVLTQDTTITAEFEKNTYTITTESENQEWGTANGGKSALYLDNVEISATANYGYHFARWDDGNTQNPRTVTATEDKTYTATFAKNTYNITKKAEHGYIYGSNYAEYLDEVTMTVNADYGYHFTQWSDGNTENPRTVVLTQDTTFTAEFAVDKSGTCGDNLALRWEYDSNSKSLTISGSGTLNSNYTFGVEAPNAVEKLVIAEGVTSIGNSAFAEYSTLKHLSVAASVKTIHEQAFYNCTGLEEIYCYRATPPTAYSNTFDGIEKFECVLHVLSASVNMYKAATGWRDFYYVQTIDAVEVTDLITDVTVVPTDNTAEVTWPAVEQAATYTLVISKDGVVFCTLIFNANGQLQGIAFAPSRNDYHHAPTAVKTSNGGLRFTVTGLDSGTNYHLTLNAKDSDDQVIASYTSNFTTYGVVTGIEDVKQNVQATKILRNGQILILRGDRTYTATGQEIK